MSNFIVKPISIASKRNRRTSKCGAINDADYITSYRDNGKIVRCPFYQKWRLMLDRCNSDGRSNDLSYVDCSVCNEWLIFSNFKSWMEKQDWKGKELDKDLLVHGNKVYSPSTCCFVSREVNSLIVRQSRAAGYYKQGVTFDKRTGLFMAKLSIKGKTIYLGRFKTEDEAYRAYKERKYKIIRDVAKRQPEKIKKALLKYRI